MKPRSGLRSATAPEHERVDQLFSRFDLTDRQDYTRFLLAQASAHLPIEAALERAGAAEILDDWANRRRSHLLLEDLDQLGKSAPDPVEPPAFSDSATMAGAIYVLEGSRLGGAYLERALAADLPRQFLAAPQPPGSWRKLLAKLDELLYEPRQLEGAIQSAKQVFTRFETAGRRYVEWREA